MALFYTQIDFSQLPQPTVVTQVSFDAVMAAILADLQARMAAAGKPFTALLESDPAYAVLECCAYRETLLRQTMNEMALGTMLAYAQGVDLDNIGANYSVARLTITPADPTTVPPTPAVMESDTAYRLRIQISTEGYTAAGPSGAYRFFALSATSDVIDASASSPAPGTVLVAVLSRTGDGAVPQATIDTVQAALSADTVRPLCDTVIVQSAEVLEYSIVANLTVAPTVDQDSVVANAQASAQAHADATHRLGFTAAVALIEAAIGVAGVTNIELVAPGITADIACTPLQATYCTGITLNVTGIGV